jgi:hypothetical protein
MRTRLAASLVFCVVVFSAATAHAQYGLQPASNRATGETYHVEVGGAFWNPTPDILISSEEFGIIGDQIDFVTDLGIEKKRHTQLRVVLRPGVKHKFRFEYIPLKYSAEGAIRRSLVFNGIRFPVELPVATDLNWKAYRFGYEWDFVYMDRGFVGLLLDLKYTDVEATLSNVLDTEFVRARAPIPAVGIVGRGYVMPNVSITGEFSFFKLPDSIDEDYGGNFYDFDLYGTVNFSDHFGVQGGYRSFDVFYRVESDEGQLTMKGLYFGGVARF